MDYEAKDAGDKRTIGGHPRFTIVRQEMVLTEVVYARTDNEIAADKIAAALNATEGM